MTEPTSPPADISATLSPALFRADPGQTAAAANKPGRRVAIDLDALEREGAALPFDFMLGGHRYLMSDPKEVDWQELIAAVSNPVMFFRLVLPPEDRAAFFDTHLASWKMEKLINAYMEHYGLPNVPNAPGLPR